MAFVAITKIKTFIRVAQWMVMIRKMSTTKIMISIAFQRMHTRPRSDEIAEVRRKRLKGAKEIKCCFSLTIYQDAEEEKE